MKHRHLRPWVWSVIGAIEGIVIGIGILAMFCYVFEMTTGFNPLWLLGAL